MSDTPKKPATPANPATPADRIAAVKAESERIRELQDKLDHSEDFEPDEQIPNGALHEPPDHVVKFFAEERAKREQEKAKQTPPPKRKKHKPMEATESVIWATLRSDPELFDGKLFKLDTFSGQTLLMHPVPVQNVVPAQNWKPCDVTDIHVAHMMVWLQDNNFKKVSVSRVSHAIDMEAARNAFSSAKDMLDTLPQWDGDRRLDTFWVDVCGVVPGGPGMGDQEILNKWRYLSATARCFFISIIARILRPGAKVDVVPILEGPQGTLKSSLLKVIAFERDEWFTDCMPRDLGNKDARAHLAGKLIVELAEMHQMKTTQVDALKGFLSVETDKFRPSYGRRDINQPRQCVFAGTTNSTDYFRDVTGNRRFWPIECGIINLALARQIMAQLYAEALAAYHDGEHWWLPPEIELIAEGEQDDRLSDDPWEDAVTTIVDHERQYAQRLGETFFYVTSTQGMEAVEPDKAKWDAGKQYRIALILKKLHGKNMRLPRTGKSQKRGFRFITDPK